jgi:hypothetical protein
VLTNRRHPEVDNGERRSIRMSATERRDSELVTAADLALERFDAAQDTYRRALEKAPAEALGQRRPGDDYTLAGLAYHVNAVLAHGCGRRRLPGGAVRPVGHLDRGGRARG